MEDTKEACDDVKTDVSNSSGSKDLSKSLPVEAFNNFLQGKRHMLVQDYTSAVQSLATACEMYVNHFGELAIECAEVYLLYGKALFRLSQQSAGFLGGALNDGSNEETSSESEGKENESEKNSDEEEGEENEAEANEAEKEEKEPSESTDSPQAVVDENSSEAKVETTSDPNVKSNLDAKVESNSEAKKENTSETPTEASDAAQVNDPDKEVSTDDQPSEMEENKEEGNPEENNEVEEDDLELAWNTLETAKSIFKRLDTVESQLKVAEILQLLAEISMESDNNAAAISDLKECLKIQKQHLPPDDRILAETYYQMGLALMLDKVYPEALENFRTTKSILELRVENLKNKYVDDADGTFASADKEVEISDLESVLLDIKEKIDDTEELICNKKKELEEEINEPGVSSPFKEKEESVPTNKPVSNITHLLKRKKPEEGTSEDSSKRIKISGVLNGNSNVIPSESANTEG